MNTTLNANNRVYADAIKDALSALYHLDDAGCVVQHVSIKGRKPCIVISPPPSDCGIHGALRMRTSSPGEIRNVMCVAFHGARVEWVVSAQRDTSAKAGVYGHA